MPGSAAAKAAHGKPAAAPGAVPLERFLGVLGAAGVEAAGGCKQWAEDPTVGAHHQVGPSETQIGAVLFSGKDAIRKWASDFSRKYTALNYRVEYKTKREEPIQPIYVTVFPWGGTGASTQFEAIYTNREDRRQFCRRSDVLSGEDSNLRPSGYPFPEVSLGRGLSHCHSARAP